VPACPEGALALSHEFELASLSRHDLVERRPEDAYQASNPHLASDTPAVRLRQEIKRILGRSLHVREVDAGSCNGCEVEISSLVGPYYDLERLGIQFVASPRHADMALVTGPPTRHMVEALRTTYEAMPGPKLVVAVGACGIMGGPFAGSYGVVDGVDQVLPVDAYIPGCPPRPEALIYGLLLAIGRMEQKMIQGRLPTKEAMP
jgi:Ni,Fe-hydrogenase III small subunit